MAKEKGFKISNVPGFATEAVAELVIGLALDVSRKISWSDRLMRKEPFEIDPGKKDQQVFLGNQLKGRTLGVIGLGKIGTEVVRLGNALGMKVSNLKAVTGSSCFLAEPLESSIRATSSVELNLVLFGITVSFQWSANWTAHHS